MAIIPDLFEEEKEEKRIGVIPDLFDEEKRVGVIPNLFEPTPQPTITPEVIEPEPIAPYKPHAERLESERDLFKGILDLHKKPLAAAAYGLHRVIALPGQLIPGKTREAANRYVDVMGDALKEIEETVTPEEKRAEDLLAKIGLAGIVGTTVVGFGRMLPEIIRYYRTKPITEAQYFEQFSPYELAQWKMTHQALRAFKNKPAQKAQLIKALGEMTRGKGRWNTAEVSKVIASAPSEATITTPKQLPAVVEKPRYPQPLAGIKPPTPTDLPPKPAEVPVVRPGEKRIFYRASLEPTVRIASVDEPFFYLSESKEVADRFAHGGVQGRPGAKTREYAAELNIYEPTDPMTFQGLQQNQDAIIGDLSGQGYDAISVTELDGSKTIAVFEKSVGKITSLEKPTPPKPIAKPPLEKLKPEVAEKVETTEELTEDYKAVDTEVLGDRGEAIAPTELATGILGKMKEGYRKVYDYIWTFGKVKRLDPALAKAAERSFHKATAAPELAVARLDKVMKGKQLSQKESVALTLTYEDKTLRLPAELKEEFQSFTNLFNVIDRTLKARGIMREGFPEGAINSLENELHYLRGRPNMSEKNLQRQSEITEEIGVLQKFRYLPHNVVVRRVVEAKMQKLEGAKRSDFVRRASNLSYQFRQRKGRKLLSEYHKSGLLEDEDLDIRRLSLTMLDSYYHKSAMKDLADFAYKNKHIMPKSPKLEAEGWLPTSAVGVYAPEYRGKFVSPLLAEAYQELGRLSGLARKANPYTRMLGVIKTATFAKPSYLWMMDALQKAIKGGFALNPIKESRSAGKALYHVLNKTKLYHEYHKLGLYQEMYLPGARSKKDFFEIAVRKTTTEIPNAYKIIERFTGVPFTKANRTKYLTFIPAAYRAIHQTTWVGDRVIRTNTALTFENMGFPREEATQLAARAHSAYSELSPRYRKDVGLVAYVQSFRVLMPRELIENALIDPIATLIGKTPINKPHIERMAKSLAAIIFLPILAEMYFKSKGFEREKAMWKWKKRIEVDDKEYELVIGINNIINMPAKWIHRLLTYDPLDETPRLQQGLQAFIKWEVHPVYRVVVDIKNNDKSIGGQIYNREDSPLAKGTKSFAYAIGQWFAILRGAYDAMERAGMGENDRMKVQKQAMDEALTLTDKMIVKTFGYAYIRGTPERRWDYYESRIKQEHKRREGEIKRAGYSRETENKKLDLLDVWEEGAIKWAERKSQ